MNGEVPKWSWYVLYGYPGQENTLRDRLHQRLEDARLLSYLGEVLVPAEKKKIFPIPVTGQARTVYPELFPGAVFIKAALSAEVWQVIRQTPGLTGYYGFGNKPQAYPTITSPNPRAFNSLPEAQSASFETGAVVRILKGPFREMSGVIMEADHQRSRLRVMIEFHQRPTPVDLSYDEIIND